jgi:hypothetical protein
LHCLDQNWRAGQDIRLRLEGAGLRPRTGRQ